MKKQRLAKRILCRFSRREAFARNGSGRPAEWVGKAGMGPDQRLLRVAGGGELPRAEPLAGVGSPATVGG